MKKYIYSLIFRRLKTKLRMKDIYTHIHKKNKTPTQILISCFLAYSKNQYFSILDLCK